MMRVLREENRVPETLDVRKMMDERRYYFYRRLETELIEIPGATTFLRTLSSRVPLALATSNLRETYDHILRIAGWNGLFSVLVGADDVTHPKPAPDIYQETVRRLNLPPEDCLVFEDSLPGLDAARTAGLEVVGVATSLPAETLLKHGARTTIRDFADREALLGALAKR
jgi:HAD superfamily hydrolase (TIGR01509 family)